ncbi:MAG TPA: acyl-CoA carboxylase subunit beta, partial [Hellea balneolensis]|nr:acyl-CoA carboxylase subunit beta [Hellea balneolensis]
MSILRSEISSNSPEFATNKQAMLERINAFRSIESQVEQAIAAKRGRYAKRGWLLPRERLTRLLDPGAPFLELSSLAGYKMFDDKDGTG